MEVLVYIYLEASIRPAWPEAQKKARSKLIKMYHTICKLAKKARKSMTRSDKQVHNGQMCNMLSF